MGQLDGEVALSGVFTGINAAAPALTGAAPASTINVSSIAGLQGQETLPGCTDSKFRAVAPPAV